jgi:6-phosphogluconolactonase (cycloisomerase 2 family)
VTWSAAPAGYLSVSLANSTQNEGVVYGLSATPSGMPVTVTATYTGGSATIQITVTGPTLQSITVTDADNGIAPAGGLGDQFTATGVYSDQSTNNLTNYVNWGSSVTTVAQFTGTFGTIGLASPLAPGDTLVTAGFTIGSANPIVGTEVLTVGTLQSITVTDADNGTAPPSTTDQFTATGTYAGGATQNLTTLVNWSSGNTAVALFQSSPAPAGDALTGVTGTALITATLTAGTSAPVTGSETLTVSGTAPTLVSIAVTPATQSIAAGLTQQYTATGTYSSGPNQVLTTGVTWASSNTGAATINGTGLATGVAAGTTNITATVGAISSPPTAVTLTVTAPVLQSISLTPTTASIQVGQTQVYTLTGNYSNGSQPITTGITWSSNPTSVATINSSGVATGVSTGNATISAVYSTFTSNSATLTVTPATAASVSRYLVDLSVNGISVDAIVPGTGQLRASNIDLVPSLEESVAYAIGLLVNPNGQMVYLLTSPSVGLQITQYSISASGQLTAGTNVTGSNWNSSASAIVIDPLGRFIFVTDFSGNFWVIPLDAAGNLGTPVQALSGAGSTEYMAIDPSGTYLYAVSEPNLTSYKIGSSGTLTSIGSVSGPTDVGSVVVAPSGKVLYVLNASGHAIDAYSSSAGVLTALANSPFNVSSSGDPEQMAIDPSGSYLYVVEQSTDGLYGFTIGSDGALTAMQSGSSFAVGQTPNYINVDAGSQFLYVNNRISGDIWVYSIASGTGLLTKASEIRTQGYAAQGIVSGSAGLTFTSTQAFVTNVENSGGTITQYTIDPATGGLSGLATPIGAGNDPLAVATDPFGLYLYDAASSSNEVFGYSTSSSGLSSFTGNPFGAGNGPSGLTTDISGSFLYATMQTDDSIWKYDLKSGVPTGGAKTVSTFGTGPVFVATEPTGQYVYVANTATPTIDFYKINLPDGSLAADVGGTLATGSSQRWIAVDPSGRYAYSADPVGNVVWQYTINGSGVLALNSPSSISAGSSVSTPGPSSVVVEPSGTYLYATNEVLGQIYAFSINPATGVLSKVTGSLSGGAVADTGTSPMALAVDISGKYLYCVNAGTSGTGSINTYSINLANGSLTAVGAPVTVTLPGGITTIGTVQ